AKVQFNSRSFEFYLPLEKAISSKKKKRAEKAYARGMKMAKWKVFPKALYSFNQCLNFNPYRWECFWEKGWVHFYRGEWKKAYLSWKEIPLNEPNRKEEIKERVLAARELYILNRLMIESKKSLKAKIPKFDEIRTRWENESGLTVKAVGDTMLGTAFPDGH